MGVKHSIVWRLTFLVLIAAGLVLGLMVGGSFFEARAMLVKELKVKSHQMALAVSWRVESIVKETEEIVEAIAATQSLFSLSNEDIVKYLRRLMEENQTLLSLTFAMEPKISGETRTGFAPCIYREGDQLKAYDFSADNHRYDVQDWYVLPKELGKPQWTEPYYEDGLIVSYCVPIFSKGSPREFAGVVTGEISLDWLSDHLKSLPLGESGYAYLISGTGTYIAHRDRDLIMNESIFSRAQSTNDASLRRFGQDMIKGKSGFFKYSVPGSGMTHWIFFQPISHVNWSLGLELPEKDVLAMIYRLSRINLAVGGGGFLLLIVVLFLISRSFTRPISRLAEVTQIMAGGNLDVAVPKVPGADEVAYLAQSFDTMRLKLKDYLEQIKITTAAKERIESELKIAKTIQMSFVPHKFPTLREDRRFQIYAALEPAREVGGDLYDFYLIQDRYLYFCVGDVSDKGVPAALYMSATQILMRSAAQQHVAEPDQILNWVNQELCRENESAMFTTAFCAVLDLLTGELKYSNAGHNPPLFLSKGGRPAWMKIPEGIVLGVMPEAKYQAASIGLKTGDCLVAYTDGVTEAKNTAGRLYSDARLLQMGSSMSGNTPQKIVETLQHSVHHYAEGATQSDDITILALEFMNAAEPQVG